MKIILTLLIAGYVFADQEIQNVRGPVEDIVEKFRKIIPEPIELDNFDLVIPDNILVSGTVNVTNFIASGLKAFTFKFRFLPLPGFKMGLENFTLDTKYAVEIPLFKIPLLSIFGDGTISIVVSNMNIDAGINPFALKGKKAITSLTLDINKIEFSISGFFDDVDLSKEISDFIGTYAMQIFQKNRKTISEFIRKALNELVYAVMHKNKTLSMDKVADIAYEADHSLSFSEALNHILTPPLL